MVTVVSCTAITGGLEVADGALVKGGMNEAVGVCVAGAVISGKGCAGDLAAVAARGTVGVSNRVAVDTSSVECIGGAVAVAVHEATMLATAYPRPVGETIKSTCISSSRVLSGQRVTLGSASMEGKVGDMGIVQLIRHDKATFSQRQVMKERNRASIRSFFNRHAAISYANL